MRWKARAISGGTSFPPASSGSSRPKRTGRPAASPTSPTNTSSFRCRNEPSALPPTPLAGARRQPFLKVPALTAMLASDLPLPLVGRGKVRDLYAVGEDRVLLLTTDRISAFDVVMAETIPMKGAVLTQISAWWFDRLLGGGARPTDSAATRI